MARIGTLPNLLGLFRLIVSPILAALVLWPFPGAGLLAFLLFVPAALSDFLDGWLARARGEVSTLGAFLDMTADKVLVAAILIALVDAGVAAAWVVVVIVVRELVVGGVRQAAASERVVVASEIIGKAKTWVILVAIAALLLAFDAQTDGPLATVGIGPLAAVVGSWLLLAGMLLALISGLDYLVKAWPVLAGRPEPAETDRPT